MKSDFKSPNVQTGQKPAAVKKKKRWSKEDTELTCLGFPTFIWYVLFSYLPMFGILIAFKQYKLFPRRSFLYSLWHSDFVGLDIIGAVPLLLCF